MNRICRYAHKIQEMWSAPMDRVTPVDDAPPHIVGEDDRMRYAGWTRSDLDDSVPSNWQCGWLSSFADVPEPIRRSSGGNYLRAGECDACPCFAEVAISIPGMK